MSKADPQTLQIQSDAGDAQQQERFAALVRDVALGRAAVAEWQDRFARYQQAVEPLRRELHAAWRQWVLALDRATLQPGLSRAERDQLGDLLRQAVAPLLGADDPEMAAVAARHAEDTPSAQPLRQDADDAAGDEERVQDFAEDWERQAAAAAAQRSEWAAKRRAASAANRRGKKEQEVSQSVRDVYRRLASALHPDREPDPRQQERKTTLMQQANQAYGQRDLLALLELQRQSGQIDAADLAGADRRRLPHYIVVLQEQLAQLQREARELETEFRAANGLPAGSGLQARKADRVISAEAQRLRGDLLLLRRQTRSLLDVETLKQWLREQRKSIQA
jgi:hypothetical protein